MLLTILLIVLVPMLIGALPTCRPARAGGTGRAAGWG
jgi:hypothetical protein